MNRDEELRQQAQREGQIWEGSEYFALAEHDMDAQAEVIILPFVQDCDFSVVVDLAAGHGRNSERLAKVSQRLIVVDILEDNIRRCRERLGHLEHLEFMVNDGVSLSGIEDSSVTLVYCFDAMVHFDSDVVREYLAEFERVLVPGGRAFCHHSNYTAAPGGDFLNNPGARNFMSQELFAHYAHKAGLQLLRAQVIDWAGDQDLDCLSLIAKPGSADA